MANQPFKPRSAFTGRPMANGPDNKQRMNRAPGQAPEMDPTRMGAGRLQTIAPQPTARPTVPQVGPGPAAQARAPQAQAGPPSSMGQPQFAGQPGTPPMQIPQRPGMQRIPGQGVPQAAQAFAPQPQFPGPQGPPDPQSPWGAPQGSGEFLPPTDDTDPIVDGDIDSGWTGPGDEPDIEDQPGGNTPGQQTGYEGQAADIMENDLSMDDQEWADQQTALEAQFDQEAAQGMWDEQNRLAASGFGASGMGSTNLSFIKNKAELGKAQAINDLNFKRQQHQLDVAKTKLESLFQWANLDQAKEIHDELLVLSQEIEDHAYEAAQKQQAIDAFNAELDRTAEIEAGNKLAYGVTGSGASQNVFGSGGSDYDVLVSAMNEQGIQSAGPPTWNSQNQTWTVTDSDGIIWEWDATEGTWILSIPGSVEGKP